MTAQNSLLAPLFVLAGWTMIMLFWGIGKGVVVAKRQGLEIPLKGTRVRDLEPHLPQEASWARHNYEHLVEQPTVFYAVVVALAMMGNVQVAAVYLAWGYVGLRMIHSVYQSTINVGPVRGMIFILSTLCLIALIVLGCLRIAGMA